MIAHPPIDVERILAGLKPFQRRSVDYVFDRLYGANPTRRFLLADEVGLGKTLVGRGLIAKAIVHLRSRGAKRINVVYICSNADIARQNISRLNVTAQDAFRLATRITHLPEEVHDLDLKPLNFISFTPGTSFSFRKSTGQSTERRLLYFLLRRTWPKVCRGAGAKNLLQGSKELWRFRKSLSDYDPVERIDAGLADAFSRRLRDEDKRTETRGERGYRRRLRDLCVRFRRTRKHIPSEDKTDRNVFIGEMRALLAATCIDALKPDLIILDEFQRFKDLLKPDDPAGELARHLFTQGEARVLLLSATPYKMYTLAQEAAEDDHYKDFIGTIAFLYGDDSDNTKRISGLLTEYGTASIRANSGNVLRLREIKSQVEDLLRQVVCRTEKLAVTQDRNGMLVEVRDPSVEVEPRHVQAYLQVRRVADALSHGDVLEYWKSSPYLLSFMDADHYKLKELLRETAKSGGSRKLADALSSGSSAAINPRGWRAYEEVELCHAYLERSSAGTVGAGWWRLLWIPPSLPYYQLSGPFAGNDVPAITKRLVFSGWHVVPRALSALLSYQAERQMMRSLDPDVSNTETARKRHRPLLVFGRSDGLPAGMSALGLMYPSTVLATIGDPLAGRAGEMTVATLTAVLDAAAQELRGELDLILGGARTSGPEDEAWYWAAPILLDRHKHRVKTEKWFADAGELASAWSGELEETTGWDAHVRLASDVARGRWRPKGRPPADLAEVLALLAVAGPANCALRALAHTLGGRALYLDGRVREFAGNIAWGLRSLFNAPEVTSMIRGLNRAEPYWRRVLEYSADGCLQAVLDEYVHMLLESEGLADKGRHAAAEQLAKCVADAASLRAANPGLDWVEVEGERSVRITNQRVRARFAMRFGDEHGDQDSSGVRKDVVRDAFNSPFWPFVLATTSVGQEGLDFHPYCHAVVHWNLPSNPVDLEQREGRVHRFKGHAVRKNVATAARLDGVATAGGRNPWPAMFQHAEIRSGDPTGIKPFWVFPLEGGASIERHTAALPLSREAARLPELRVSLAVYRMVFGQPRQDDLVEHLRRTVPEGELKELVKELAIDLGPKAPADPLT